MKKNKNVISEKTIDINGQQVTLQKFKPKDKKREFHDTRHNTTSCPNCLSRMTLNSLGTWECSGDRLRVWESEFIKYRSLDKEKKLKYITDLSNSSRFLELFDRWEYAYNSDGKEVFGCGYTNILFPLNGSVQVRIPDPSFTKILEQKLGRPLKEEELYEEEELFFYAGRVLTKYREGAKVIRIPWIVLPSESTMYLPKDKPEEEV